jgi:Flp pilus assembly protein TadG
MRWYSDPKRNSRRRGAAVIEMAMITPIMLLLIFGLWELGRIIQVQQQLQNAVRDSARIASQGQIITPTGEYVRIGRTTGAMNVEDTVRDQLQAAGLTNLNGVVIEFTYLDGNTSNATPADGTKNQAFRIRVSIPYDNVKWTNLNFFRPNTIQAETTWRILVDDPFQVPTQLPSWSGY